ncbi:ABC transporter substrate-binding protein [Micromonospora craniellae]|nr:ABC transporter substrate-binding protein [Micromonospora craniellae]
MASLLVVTGLVACSTTATPGSTGAGDGAETRTVTDWFGEVTIPVAPERIVALDENAALNLLMLGMKPQVTYNAWGSDVAVKILQEAGVEVRPMTGGGRRPAVEDVANIEPDLIVVTAVAGSEQELAPFGDVAPTLRAPYMEPWRELVSAYGRYFDKGAASDKVIEVLTSMTKEVATKHADRPKSLSVLLGAVRGDSVMVTDSSNSLSTVIAESGFTRPAGEEKAAPEGQSYGGWVMLSPEQIPQHDADIVAVPKATYYDEKIVTRQPLFQALPAVKQGRAPIVNGDMWTGGYGFAVYWVLVDLAAFASGSIVVGTEADAAQRWKQFQSLITA